MAAGLMKQGQIAFAPAVFHTRLALGTVSTSEHPKNLPEAFAPDFCIRNTFIDSATSRRPSLEDFLPRARCVSAPSPMIGARMRHMSTVEQVHEDVALGWSETDIAVSSSCAGSLQPPPYVSTSLLSLDNAREGGNVYQRSFTPAMTNQAGMYSTVILPMPQAGAFSSVYAAAFLSAHDGTAIMKPTSNAQAVDARDLQIPQPSDELVSEGSSGHGEGTCKPCAWFYSAKGCQTALWCKFCHACPPGELKRRKKEKNMMLASQKAILGA